MGVRFWWSPRQHLVMALRLLALVSWLSVAAHGQVSKIKDDLKQCANSGQDLNSCLTDLAVAIKPYLKNPIIDVHVEFTENEVTGLSEHELLFINADKAARTIEMSMFIPRSKSVGKYVIEGKVAVLELEAYAPSAYVTEFTNTTVSGKARLNIRDNRVVIDEDPEITIDVGGLNIKMDNLFNGQADQLAKTVDKFLNQNTDKFIKDFQPAIAKSVSGFLKGFYNGAVSNIDISVFQ